MVAVGVKPFELVSQLCDILKEKTVTSYACALHFHGNTVHIAGLISPHLMKEKKKKRQKSSGNFSSL